MSFVSLPTELCLLIISFAVIAPPSPDHQSYSSRQKTLRALSLVHRSWTRIAQESLRKEVWIDGFDQEDEEEMERKSDQLISSDLCETEFLTVDGAIGHFLDWTGVKKWGQIKYLRLFMVENAGFDEEEDPEGDQLPEYAYIRDIALFPHIEELVLAKGLLVMSESDSDLPFPNLRRLTMRGDMEINDLGSTPTPVFTRDHTPQLTTLALEETQLSYWGFEHHFSGVFDQITTLAVKDSGDSRYLGRLSSLAHLSKLRNLRHLSLDMGTSIEHDLLAVEGLHLESLHLSSKMLVDEPDLKELLEEILDGEIGGLQVDRIVIYGHESGLVHGSLDKIEISDDRESPPFEDFDGR